MKRDEALILVARRTRVNLEELGRTGLRLLKIGLVEKDWHRNDAAGEAVVLTEKGMAVVDGYIRRHKPKRRKHNGRLHQAAL